MSPDAGNESLLSLRPAYAGTARYTHRRVAQYFDRTQYLYSLLWSRNALHYGFWDSETHRRRDAIQNVNKFVATELALPVGARVLDAGCGVGGTSLFLAEHAGLQVNGITLSREQLRRARRFAASSTAKYPPIFTLGDYANTHFPSGSFDGVIAVESSCHAPSKCEFLREARRLLRPGGRLVVIDGFLAKVDLNDRERRLYLRLLNGFALPDLAEIERFARDLDKVGFSSVRFCDRTAAILRSARIIAAMSWPGIVLLGAFCWVGLLPQIWLAHGLACLSQRPLFAKRIARYCAFVATASDGSLP
jgi:tocopherol O-methyltransferase